MVALIPARFMSNMVAHGRPLLDGGIYDNVKPDRLLSWIFPNDIGAAVVIVLIEDVHKYADNIYNLTGQVLILARVPKLFQKWFASKFLKFKSQQPLNMTKLWNEKLSSYFSS